MEDSRAGEVMKNNIVLFGGGGHCKVVIDAIRKSGNFNIYGILDPNIVAGELVLGVKVLGSDNIIPDLLAKGIMYSFISIGSITDCAIRKKIDITLKESGFKLPVIVHPSAILAEEVKLGEGTFVAAGVVINTDVKIGRNVIINTSSSVDHDCVIGDFAHIAPGVTLSGGVNIGNETHIGTGARVTQYLTIGQRCVVGAGQTIRHDMESEQKSY